MRGKELDTQIEHELQLMLIEGFDKSPISAKSLHARLKSFQRSRSCRRRGN